MDNWKEFAIRRRINQNLIEVYKESVGKTGDIQPVMQQQQKPILTNKKGVLLLAKSGMPLLKNTKKVVAKKNLPKEKA